MLLTCGVCVCVSVKSTHSSDSNTSQRGNKILATVQSSEGSTLSWGLHWQVTVHFYFQQRSFFFCRSVLFLIPPTRWPCSDFWMNRPRTPHIHVWFKLVSLSWYYKSDLTLKVSTCCTLCIISNTQWHWNQVIYRKIWLSFIYRYSLKLCFGKFSFVIKQD